jgi:hypothetical protein
MKAKYLADLTSFAKIMERRAMDDRKDSNEARVLVCYDALGRNGSPTCSEICAELKNRYRKDDPHVDWFTPKRVGNIFRGMGVDTRHTSKGKIVEIEAERRRSLYDRFGIGDRE